MTNTMPSMSMSLPIGNLDAYIASAQQIPLLTLQEEQDLTKRYHEQQDIDAARRLVLSHLRYVVRIARGYLGYGLALGDLIQEGNIGLMKAVKRFNPSYGVRLVSFAVHWIKAEIHEFVIRNWRIVKVATTKAQRKLFFNLRSMKSRLGWFTQEEVAAVAKDLNVSCQEVLTMEQRLNAMDAAYDPQDSDDDNSQYYNNPANYLESQEGCPSQVLELTSESTWQNQQLHDAMQQLDERSQAILRKRWLTEKKATLHELADHYQVSAERIRQIEQNAMKKIKASIESAN